jgi:hypothetical protein
MLTDVAHVSVVPRAATVGPCDLCGRDGVERAAAITVKHSRGGSVSFVACDGCARAVRRVAAAAGGQARFTPDAADSGGPAAVAATSRRPAAAVAEPAPELIEERAERLRDLNGTEYVVRVCGRPRSGGTWEGWIEFLAVGAAVGVRTDVETTQPSRADLAYWASGLEPLYFDGAFRRAHTAVGSVGPRSPAEPRSEATNPSPLN